MTTLFICILLFYIFLFQLLIINNYLIHEVQENYVVWE